jgi:hypothetical protein
MSDKPEASDSATGDLEYDLAHENIPPGQDAGAEQAHDRAVTEPVRVATQTPDFDSDFGYDMAHELPRD